MSAKLRNKVIECPHRKRDVEVTYAVTGNWFSPAYEIVSCPAMYQSSVSCNRICKKLISHSPGYMHFDMYRYGRMR
jgi:hypothetical protein